MFLLLTFSELMKALNRKINVHHVKFLLAIFYDNCRGSNFLKLSPGTWSSEAYSWQLFFRDIKVGFKEKLSGYSSSSQEQCVGCF